MLGLIFAAFAFVFAAPPAFRWIVQVDASGMDTFAGIATDSQGNTYVAGNTLASNFPVKAAAQDHLASNGLYRIDGPGKAYTALGLTSASSIVADAGNPNVPYATASNSAVKSWDGGTTFSTLPIPSAQIFVIAVSPANDQILYAGTDDPGVMKSADGGATWSAINNGLVPDSSGQIVIQNLWIDPNMPAVLFATSPQGVVRSGDGGASWETILAGASLGNLYFATDNPGVIYAVNYDYAGFKSTDGGQTFNSLTAPGRVFSIISDPNHPGRLLAGGQGGISESDDGGSTWTTKNTNPLIGFVPLVPDWANGVLYAATAVSVFRISSDLQTIALVGPPAVPATGIAVANGHAYVAAYGTHDVFVTKFDRAGNVVYATYFGGSADDIATAIAVDAAGNAYVTGTTGSADFPVTKGAFASSGNSFLFKLNPDGSIGYSTYFATGEPPSSIAVDSMGSAYLAGASSGGLPTTPGAYQTSCQCGVSSDGFFSIFSIGAFLTKFDPARSMLIFSTYVGPGVTEGLGGPNPQVLALASDGSAYMAGQAAIFHINATGTSLLSSTQPIVNPQAMAVASDGSVYAAGSPQQFQATAGAFQTAASTVSMLPGQAIPIAPGIVKMDGQLATILAATYFGGRYWGEIEALTVDSSGNVYIGGSAAPQGLPTRTPIQSGFAPTTGFLSELSGNLSTLLFSSYFGDTEYFDVQGVAIASDGSVLLAGMANPTTVASGTPGNVYVNSLALTPPPALRIDTVTNAASLLDGPISVGETIVVRGAGFGSDAQLSIDDAVVREISITPNAITALVPSGVPLWAAEVRVRSGGAASNQVLVPVAAASPGIFSQDGSGYGQGYILNKDGTLNTPSNPAHPNDPITIFATGVGPVSFTEGYAVTQFPVNVGIDGFYADGIAAVMGPVSGFPGSVYQISVHVPDPASFASIDPNLVNFTFPPLVGVMMQITGASSQNGLAISIAQ